jgi:hypothetical protein
MTRRDTLEYFGEFVRTSAMPAAPCGHCNVVVFYILTENERWRCRTCEPPGHDGWRTVACLHLPQCDPPEHMRTAILRWFVAS